VKVKVSVKTGSRPSNVRRRKNVAVISNPKRRYTLVGKSPVTRPAPVAASIKLPPVDPKAFRNEELGVTFWRLRPKVAEEDDDAPTFPVRIGERTEQWTAERVASTTAFQKGDRVRFTIESSRTGYMYIINREFYKDGTAAAPEIVFPTTRTRGGNNGVVAGSLIEVPSSMDSVSYFTVKPRRPDYAGEELLVLILPNELPNFEIGPRAQAVDIAVVEKWLSDWGALVDIFDAEDGAGVAYTSVEADAAVSSRSLTREEPLPQTIYKVRVRKDQPMLIAFRMNAVP
jgi:hypothetical protein